MKLSVCKEFKFSYGHFLPGHPTCQNQHGHNARMLVKVSGKIGDHGMIIDFAHLKEIVHQEVLCTVDHNNLNDIDEIKKPPTVENLCEFAFEKIDNRLQELNKTYQRYNPLVLEEITIYETDGAFAQVVR